MFLREAPDTTLSGLLESMEITTTLTESLISSEVHLDAPNGVIGLGAVEVPLTKSGLDAFSAMLDIPAQFLLRQTPDVQQMLITALIGRAPGIYEYVHTDEALLEIRDPGTQVIPPIRLVGALARAIDGQAPVRDFWSDSADFRLDVYAPEGFDRGIGGDRKIGDLSSAGVRVMQDRKHNLAPQVIPFQYRLVCTNGMASRADGLKIDSRGSTVEQVLAEFEAKADIAFRRAEASIGAMYDLREQRVTNPERTLMAIAAEQHIPDRTLSALLARVPSIVRLGEHLTMFDIVNLITNQANDPDLWRPGARLALEMAGGSVVSDHQDRCSVCQHALRH